jgi:hypothetical protein
MAKSIRANLQLASIKDVEDICAIDAKEVSSKPDKYVKVNLLGYYILINTWLMMIRQWSEYGWISVLGRMAKFGLFDVIRNFDAAAQQFICGEEIEFSIARTLWNDVKRRGHIEGVPTLDTREFHSNPDAAFLILMRYGKRFSPLSADKLREQSISEFIALQKDLKFAQRSFDLGFIRPYVREACASLVNWDKLCDELDSFDLSDLVFTPGVSFDTSADLVSKLRSVAKERVEYFPTPFGIPLVSHVGSSEPEYWGKHNQCERHTVRLSAVPKNYKKARIIAPEEVIRQATARRYFQIMDRYTPSLIHLHDQTVNQTLAKAGSVDGSLATIDLSSASDRITWSLLREILPARFCDILERVLPTHFVQDTSVRMLYSAATMGNSVTFWLESVVFAGISKAGTEFAARFLDLTCNTVSIYGDDIIVPTNAAQTVIEFLEKCGFVVNTDKSFFNSEGRYYRESCGEEYWDGTCVSSLYFPRFPIEGTFGNFSTRARRDGFTGARFTSLDSVVDLQHKMYVTCVPAGMLLADLIREADPKITSSTPDEGFADLYDYESQPVVMPAPAGRWVDGKLKKVVIEGQLRYGHSASVWIASRNVVAKPEDRLLVDLYNYQQFLKFGPRYESALDELLGISSPPISYAEASLDGSITRVLIK